MEVFLMFLDHSDTKTNRSLSLVVSHTVTAFLCALQIFLQLQATSSIQIMDLI